MRRLINEGHQVFSFDIEDGDITKDKCLEGLKTRDIQHVFHLAGKTFVPESWSNPALFYKINVFGTLNVLEFCRTANCSITLISSYLYGEPEYLPIDEKHPLNAHNPYSHSKLMADELCRYYNKTFNIRSCIFRVFNVYGPGQASSFLISEVIKKIFDIHESVVEVMDLRPRRDFIYIDDVIDALILSLEGKPGIYNVGSGYSVGVEEIVTKLMGLANIRKPFKDKRKQRQNEILDLYADITYIKDKLGWQPKTLIDEGLAKCLMEYDKY